MEIVICGRPEILISGRARSWRYGRKILHLDTDPVPEDNRRS